MTLLGRIFWTLLLVLIPLMCLEDYLSGNDVDPVKTWREYNSAFKSRFQKEPTKEEV